MRGRPWSGIDTCNSCRHTAESGVPAPEGKVPHPKDTHVVLLRHSQDVLGCFALVTGLASVRAERAMGVGVCGCCSPKAPNATLSCTALEAGVIVRQK